MHEDLQRLNSNVDGITEVHRAGQINKEDVLLRFEFTVFFIRILLHLVLRFSLLMSETQGSKCFVKYLNLRRGELFLRGLQLGPQNFLYFLCLLVARLASNER